MVIGGNVSYLEQSKVGKVEVGMVEVGKDDHTWGHSFPHKRGKKKTTRIWKIKENFARWFWALIFVFL